MSFLKLSQLVTAATQRFFSSAKPTVASPSATTATATAAKRGLFQFFENGQSLPIYDPDKKVPIGRAWKASELRLKSFEDLHKLWWVLARERNLLATQAHEARRLGQVWFGKHREQKCKLSMARIKTVLTERKLIHEQAVQLVSRNAASEKTEADLLLEADEQAVRRRTEMKRWVRKLINYRQRRDPLFT